MRREAKNACFAPLFYAAMMTPTDREALASIALLAAFADGQKQEAERAQLKALFESIEADASPHVYQRVLLGQTTVEAEAEKLSTPALRTFAYEMAVGVCDADGVASAEEQAFLGGLRSALGLEEAVAAPITAQGESLAHLADLPPVAPVAVAPSETPTSREPAGVDSVILKYAVLCGGLELLPQTLASMAVVPLQAKLVHSVGQQYGYALDKGHVRELLAVMGVGMTSQVMESYARKFFGKAVKKTLGKKMGKVAKKATGPLLAFATTFAIGQVAKRYYASGRTLSNVNLKSIYQENVTKGQQLYSQYSGQVAESARSTNLNNLMSMIR